MTFRASVLLAAVVALLAAARATDAKLCGDAVDGQDVPCACGDVVASDVVLGASDPVTQEACPTDGLVVRAPQASAGITVDLHGEALRGTGHGAGLLLLDGRPRVVSTAGPATIRGYQDGVFAHGDTAAALVADLVVTDVRRDGVRIEAPGVEVRDTIVRGAGRDGFGFAGKGYQVSRTRSEGSRRHGFAVWGANGAVSEAVAVGSGGNGFYVMGMGHALTSCTATGGASDGIKLWGMHFTITGCTASDNAGDGIEGMGMDWHLAGNVANDNGGDGLRVYGYWLIDDGGNSGAGNRGIGKRRDPDQCEIAEQACRP